VVFHKLNGSAREVREAGGAHIVSAVWTRFWDTDIEVDKRAKVFWNILMSE